MAICGKMKSKRQWVTRDKRFDAFNGSCGKAAANISHFSKSKTHDMIKKPCLSTREKQGFSDSYYSHSMVLGGLEVMS